MANIFEQDKIHGYRISDLNRALKGMGEHAKEMGSRIEVMVPTKSKAVGRALFVYDGHEWLLREVK